MISEADRDAAKRKYFAALEERVPNELGLVRNSMNAAFDAAWAIGTTLAQIEMREKCAKILDTPPRAIWTVQEAAAAIRALPVEVPTNEKGV